MTSTFVHFVDYRNTAEKTLSPDDYADQIEQCIRDMMEKGEQNGGLTLEIPDNLSPEEAMLFVDEIMKRFRDMDNENE